MRGNPQALFGKRPTEKDPAKGTSPAVDFTRREVRGDGPGAIPAPRPGPTHPRGQDQPAVCGDITYIATWEGWLYPELGHNLTRANSAVRWPAVFLLVRAELAH